MIQRGTADQSHEITRQYWCFTWQLLQCSRRTMFRLALFVVSPTTGIQCSKFKQFINNSFTYKETRAMHTMIALRVTCCYITTFHVASLHITSKKPTNLSPKQRNVHDPIMFIPPATNKKRRHIYNYGH
jgi:hypothetical protein